MDSMSLGGRTKATVKQRTPPTSTAFWVKKDQIKKVTSKKNTKLKESLTVFFSFSRVIRISPYRIDSVDSVKVIMDDSRGRTLKPKRTMEMT